MTVAPPEIEFASMIAHQEGIEIPCDVGDEFCRSKKESGAEWWMKIREHKCAGTYTIDVLVCAPCKKWILDPETSVVCGCLEYVQTRPQVVGWGKI